MLCLKTGILLFTMFILSLPFSDVSPVSEMEFVKARFDARKTYIVICQDTILQTARRSHLWHIPAGTVVEKISAVYARGKEVWHVASLNKGILGSKQSGEISLEDIRKQHRLIEPTFDGGRWLQNKHFNFGLRYQLGRKKLKGGSNGSEQYY